MTCDDRKLKGHVNNESVQGTAVGVAIFCIAVSAVATELSVGQISVIAVEYCQDNAQDLENRNTVAIAGVWYSSGWAGTARFDIQQFYVLPTQCVYVFCVDLRTNSYYFPIQH
jgi:hypothetical protein